MATQWLGPSNIELGNGNVGMIPGLRTSNQTGMGAERSESNQNGILMVWETRENCMMVANVITYLL
jgi:hypothetical protein